MNIVNILWGMLGIVVILGIAYLFSTNRKQVEIRTIVGGLGLQIVFAFLALESSAGQAAMQWLTDVVTVIIDYANEGIDFLFGPLVGEGEVFAFEVLGVIIFFASLIAVLYYYGIMQWVINILGGGLSKLLKTTKIESLSGAANIFVGHTEAPLVVEPYISTMHNSELFAVMVGGMGSAAGANLVGYSLLGIPLEYLIAASFMSAPASLLIAKIMMPLPEELSEKVAEGEEDIRVEEDEEDKPSNVIDAAAQGASTGVTMVIEIAAMLLAFVALIALITGILGFRGGLVGIELTLEGIFGVILSPIAFVIGIPMEEAVEAAQFIGQKIAINEFIAFEGLGNAMEMNALTPKTGMILSFALTGFANFGSIAIQIGGLSSLAPDRRKDVSNLGLKAMVGGVMASLLKATIAGMFF